MIYKLIQRQIVCRARHGRTGCYSLLLPVLRLTHCHRLCACVVDQFSVLNMAFTTDTAHKALTYSSTVADKLPTVGMSPPPPTPPPLPTPLVLGDVL